MRFHFSRQGLQGRDARLQRWLEMVPGATSWAILLGMPVLAFTAPVVAAILMIAFELYWLLRLLYMTLFLVLSHYWLTVEQSTDWMARVRALDALAQPGRVPTVSPDADGAAHPLSRWSHRRDMAVLQRSGSLPPPSQEIYHLVIFTIAKERRELYEEGVRSLTRQVFPSQRILVVLAVEERAQPEIRVGALAARQHFRPQFLDVLVVVHPNGLPGEARVKGANATYAAKAAAAYFAERRIPTERIVVSCFDADTVVSPSYFACLTYHFLVSPSRARASFQPIPVYHNNIWEVPGFARVLDVGSSFFQLIEATNPDQLVTFSSHSMSFQALVDIGYWPVDLISDDSAIFWKAFIHYDGRYRVVPMYVTVSMDVAASESWRQTVANVYKQKRRWAWGVENFPIVLRAFVQGNTLPFMQRLKHGYKLFESHVAWATWPFLLTVIVWLPAIFAGREFSNTVLFYSAPRVATTIFSLASISLLTTSISSVCLLPRPVARNPFLSKLGHAFEWLLVPVIGIVLSAMPALDAQTRLMLGQYMEFWVTEKSSRHA